MNSTDGSTPRPSTRRLILIGLAVAVPLAAVALYFAVVAPPPPPPAAAGGESAQATLPPGHPPIGMPGESASEQRHPPVGSSSRTVRVPGSVRGKWKAVKLQVEEKDGGGPPRIFTVPLGGELDIPGSSLHVRVGDFLPALRVDSNEITSASNEPTNPAVAVTVFEDKKEIYRGWLFAKFPDMQPFEHAKYRVTLIQGVPAG